MIMMYVWLRCMMFLCDHDVSLCLQFISIIMMLFIVHCCWCSHFNEMSKLHDRSSVGDLPLSRSVGMTGPGPVPHSPASTRPLSPGSSSILHWLLEIYLCFWIKNWSHINAHLVVASHLLVGATLFKTAEGCIISNSIRMKFNKIVRQVNTHQLTELVFW